MSAQPEQVLPRFVALAMDICEADTAGMSLYEDVPGTPGIFRWHHLTGVLAPFNGGTTPRNFSPCGVCLDRRRAILVEKPERAYTWLADANISLAEVLLVPPQLGNDEPIGTLWVVAPDGKKFDSEDRRILEELAGFASIAIHLTRAEEAEKLAGA